MSVVPPVTHPLPSGWERVQMRRVVDIRNGRDYKDVEVADGGYPVYGSGGEFRRASEFLYDGESVLFGRKGTIDRPLYVSGKFWTVDTMFYAVPNERVNARFLYYFAVTIPYSYYITSTALPSMTQGDLCGHPMPLPPVSEQRAIADFLDRETQQIDELIAEQRGLIETLRKRKVALAEHLYGTYIADESPRLRRFLTDVDERAGDSAAGLPLLSVSIDWGVRRRRTGDSAQAEGDLTKYKIARQGEIVLNRMRAFQGALGVAPEDGLVSPDYSVIRPSARVDSNWLASVMRAPAFVAEMVSRVRGIGGVDSGTVRTPRLNFNDLREIRVAMPLIARQREEVKNSHDQTSHIDALITESEDLIALSLERRAALITAAVTGQLGIGEDGQQVRVSEAA